MKWTQKARQWVAKSLVRDIDHGGWIDVASAWNYWQSGQWTSNGVNNVVYACVQAYAQTIAQLPALHQRRDADGYTETLENSPVAAVLRRPNHYQTRSDFLLNLVHSLLFEGNAYALAERRAGQIVALHLVPPHACTPYVAAGEIFYHVSPEDPSGMPAMLVPARDVAHVRLHTPHNQLRGESPIYAAALAIKVNTNAMGHTSKFFEQMSRPSGILTTQEKLTAEQTAALRQRWEEMSAGVNSGKVPILGWGIDWKPLSLSATDAQLLELLKFSVEDIGRAYRVPLPIIGVLDGSTYNNVHNLLSFWKASGLGFVIEHIEQALAVLFDLPPSERIELDTDNLLRTDLLTRIDALTKGITGGLYAPNEGRRMEGLRPVEGGDMPRVQQQMVPLDYVPPEPPPSQPSQESPPVDDSEEDEEAMKMIGQMIADLRAGLEREMDHKLELARVNADLRIEQAHGTIKTLLDMHDRFEELVEGLQAELKAAQQENARLVEAYEKAVAERLEHRGPFKSGETYRRNQMTTRDGSTFICVADETGDDPRDKEAKGWRLLAMRGERGPAGATGAKGDRGEKGDKGEHGRPGAIGPAGEKGERGPRGEPGAPGKQGQAGVDGVSPVAADLVGKKLVLTLSDGEMLRVDLGKLFKGDA